MGNSGSPVWRISYNYLNTIMLTHTHWPLVLVLCASLLIVSCIQPARTPEPLPIPTPERAPTPTPTPDDKSTPLPGPREVSPSAPVPTPSPPSSVVTARLTSRQLPRPVAAMAKEPGCQKFEGGQCAELRWERLFGLRSGEFTRIRIAPSDPRVIYATLDANDMSVWKSTDAGATWQRVGHNAHSSDIIIHPFNPEIAIYAVLENNIYRTGDGGRSWKTVLTAAPGFERSANQFNALA